MSCLCRLSVGIGEVQNSSQHRMLPRGCWLHFLTHEVQEH